MPWKNKFATVQRNARWIRLVESLRTLIPRVLIVDAKCLGTLRSMAHSDLSRVIMDITVVNWDENIVSNWDFSGFPPKWTIEGLCMDIGDVADVTDGSFNAVYADICGVGNGLVGAISNIVDKTRPYVFMVTVCTGSRRRGRTWIKRKSTWNSEAPAALSIRKEPKPKKSAAMTTLEGHNSKFRAAFQPGTRVHVCGSPAEDWVKPCVITRKPTRPTSKRPWMLTVKSSNGVHWNVELSDVTRRW